MSRSTAGNLDPAGMRRIREIILGKFGKKRCTEDKEALWEKCKIDTQAFCIQIYTTVQMNVYTCIYSVNAIILLHSIIYMTMCIVVIEYACICNLPALLLGGLVGWPEWLFMLE